MPRVPAVKRNAQEVLLHDEARVRRENVEDDRLPHRLMIRNDERCPSRYVLRIDDLITDADKDTKKEEGSFRPPRKMPDVDPSRQQK